MDNSAADTDPRLPLDEDGEQDWEAAREAAIAGTGIDLDALEREREADAAEAVRDAELMAAVKELVAARALAEESVTAEEQARLEGHADEVIARAEARLARRKVRNDAVLAIAAINERFGVPGPRASD
ncbi:hypothetical protein ABT160_33760 [Streptomyces sp. NPDC001941]|uniref:hypothetical protein n=1 Tax=Streptomyces sp. NPDC001941 TaxID=3154659 RepID=UPI00331AA33B